MKQKIFIVVVAGLTLGGLVFGMLFYRDEISKVFAGVGEIHNYFQNALVLGGSDRNPGAILDVDGNVRLNSLKSASSLATDGNGNIIAGNGGAGGGLPAGAVMAFDLSNCPSGWSRFADADGRSIIGSSTNSKEKGGNNILMMSVNQLPKHSHLYEDTIYSENRSAIGTPSNGSIYSNGLLRYDWQVQGNNLGTAGNYDYDNTLFNVLRISDDTIQSRGGRAMGITNRSTLKADNGGYQYADYSTIPQQSINITNPYIKLIYCRKD